MSLHTKFVYISFYVRLSENSTNPAYIIPTTVLIKAIYFLTLFLLPFFLVTNLKQPSLVYKNPSLLRLLSPFLVEGPQVHSPWHE